MKTLEFENYFMEPLRSMEKRATIRKSDKGLKEGDLVKCTFEWTDDYLIRRVRSGIRDDRIREQIKKH